MYKKCFTGFLLSILLLACFPVQTFAAGAPKDVSAKAYVLMEADTREVLASSHALDKLSMASTTKIMTSIVALERGIPDQQVKVASDMVAVEGTSAGLLPDDLVTVRTLVYGMLLESGNDAANVTAYAVAGGVKPFLELMNQKAREIGMLNTCFETPSGLDSENHYSTAYDMALLGSYAIQNPEFRRICSLSSARVSYGNPPYARTLTNHNRLLREYDGAFGIKTGYTKKSGRCLVSAAARNGVTLVAVTLHDPNDWSDHKKLLDYGFSVVSARDYTSLAGDLSAKVVGGTENRVSVRLGSKAEIPIADQNAEVTVQVYMQPFLYAPIKAGESVGTAVYSLNGQAVLTCPLVAADSVPAQSAAPTAPAPEEPTSATLFERIKGFFQKITE